MNFGAISNLPRRLISALNLLPCPLCRKGDGGGRNAFCPECLARLPRVEGVICPGCGGELDGVLALCSQCTNEPMRPWRSAVTLFEYRGPARDLIAEFKFLRRPELARPLGILAAEELKKRGACVDAVVPVPLHFTRFLRRSYNQAELVARVIAGELSLPLIPALRRSGRGRRQSMLGRRGRLRNPRRVFAPVSRLIPQIAGKKVLLVDDVFTTGATLSAAAETLMRAGAGEITALSCARGRSYRRVSGS